MRGCRWSLSLLSLACLPYLLVVAQLSNPITQDSHIHDPENKFLQRTVMPDDDGLSTLDEESKVNSQCPSHVELRWQTEVSSSIYSTPLIADINGDGKSEVVVPSFVHYLEVLEGSDGEKLPGWPAFHKSSAHTSPLVYDVDNDGWKEILLATYNGEILVFHHSGEQLEHQKLVVPRLRVRKNWFVGLDTDHVDHAHPDIHANILEGNFDKTADEAAMGNVSGLPNLLNLPHPVEPQQEKPAEQKPAEKQGSLRGPGKDLPMPDHLPGDTNAGAGNAGKNAAADCEGETCEAKGHGATPGSQPGSSGTGTGTGSVTGPGTHAGMADKDKTATAGDANQHAAAETTTAAGAGGTPPQGGSAQPGVTQPDVVQPGGTQPVVTQPDVVQPGGTQGGAVSGATVDPGQSQPAGTTTDGGAAQVTAVADVAAGAKPEEMTQEQRTLQEGWEKWHSDLEAKNHTMTPEQKQKWDQFLVWREKQRREQGQVPTVTANQRRRLLQAVNSHHDDEPGNDKDDAGATVEPEGELDEEAAASWDVFKDEEEMEHLPEEEVPDEYHYDYDEYAHRDDMWADEDWTEMDHESNQEYIGLDSHILCTPVVADIDNDGQDELVVAASYFFDREYYEDPSHKGELEEGLDIGKYIAGAIVVFDLTTQNMRWNVHLDLTTEGTQFRGYIYSAPTVVDLDGDGHMEILVGTSVGFIYCLHHDGSSREGFPIQMGEIQGQVIAADVNGDGHLEIVAGDTKGNVAVFDRNGKELWERHTASLIAQGATVGDVNGDGQMDVVVTTTSGHVWVYNGKTGEDVGAFPFRAHGRIMVPALLVDLRKDKVPGLHIVVNSFDGYLYIIDGRTGCADAIDVGETSYSMVLADQVDGGDDLDLIVSTMNGNVYCFQTPAPYHPLKAWPSQNQGANVAFPRMDTEGVFFLPQSRQFRDVSRESFTVQFEIVDKRPAAKDKDKGTSLRGPYDVSVWLLVSGVRQRLLHKAFEQPGVYSARIPCPAERTLGTIRIEMLDEHKLQFHDEFALTFHMYFYRILKWLLVLPLLAMLAALAVKSVPDSLDGGALPSYRGGRYLP